MQTRMQSWLAYGGWCVIAVCGGVTTKSVASSANAPSWTVRPSVCVVKVLGLSCDLTLDIALFDVQNTHYCLYLDETKVRCWREKQSFQVTVTFRGDALLSLRDEYNQIILSQPLDSKALEYKRRVRSPWSLF